MKVLLFVQSGGERPKCVRSAPQRVMARGSEALVEWAEGWAEGCAAHRWWLVECENAEAGRRVIRASQDPDYEASSAAKAYWRFNGAVGRILASGGAR